ncbi:YEATS domain containing 2 homolog D12 isoform X2 [Amblyomma americanum]
MSQGQKRVIDQDPDYESIPLHAQQKRIKLHEQDAKEAAVKKIEQIVRSQFSSEISARESELDLINQRIYQLQMMLDRLRVGIITKYYASGGQAADSCSAVSGGGWEDSQQALASVHPTVRQFLGKAPLATPRSEECHSGSQEEQRRTFVTEDSSNVETTAAPGLGAELGEHWKKEGAAEESGPPSMRIGRGLCCKNKVRIIVGNISKYIPLDRRDGGEQATHKWLAYVRTAPEVPQSIAGLVRRVRFFLHPSYRPHDLVEVTEAPFQVQRKGWGEFPLRVQLHFHDRWTKHVDIIHHLKLDKTYTGLQTLGAETVVDLWIPSSVARNSENSTSAADNTIEPHGNLDTSAESASIAADSSLAANNEAKTGNELEAAGSNKSTLVSPVDQTSQLLSQTCGTIGHVPPIVTSALLDEQPCEEVTQMAVSHVSCPVLSATSGIGGPCPVQLVGICAAGSPKPEEKSTRDSMSAMSTTAEAASSLGSIAATVVTPKKVPNTAVNSNGVVSSTFVKCTDTLGRVLLIPATSLLSPPSLLQPAMAVAAAQGAASGTMVAAAASTGNLAAGGAPPASTPIGITCQQVAPSSRILGKASTRALVPASVPGIASVVPENILPNGATFTLSTGSPGLAAPSGTAGSSGVKIAPAAPRAIRPSTTSFSRTGLPMAAAGPRMANTLSVVCVTPVIKTGVAQAAADRTSNLISVVCNKPAATSVNVPAPIVPVTATADALGASSQKTATEVASQVVSPVVSLALTPAAVKPTVPSASTYTLVMLPGTGSGQSQIVVLRPKDTAPAAVVVAAQGQQLLQEGGSSQAMGAAVPPPATVLPEQLQKEVDPAKELRDKLDAIRLSECRDIREAFFAVAAHFPLVGVTEAEKVSCFPYAATDGAAYFSWPLPKQRASEWMRACDVRRALQHLVECQQPTWFSSSPATNDCQRLLPSRRSAVLLCRHFGFTPLHPDTDGDDLQHTEMGSEHIVMHNSYSEPCELVSRLANAVCTMGGAQECAHVAEEEVDVDGAEDANNGLQEGAKMLNSRTERSAVTSEGTFSESPAPGKSLLRKAKIHLPLSPVAAFVREAASEVGVHLTSCELEPRVDIPVVEEMIAAACKKFATALLRSAVNMTFKRVHYESTPSAVTLEDTYNGILDLGECSFLTNENLGIEAAREDSCDDAHV